MSAVLRITLAAALLPLAGGTVVAPHLDPPDRHPLHLDHVSSAYHLVLLSQVLGDEEDEASELVSSAPGVAALAAIALALLTVPLLLGFATPAIANLRPAEALVSARWRVAAVHGPPRAS